MQNPVEKKTAKWHMYLIYLFLISLIITGISFSRFSSVIQNTGPENTAIPAVVFSTWIMNQQASTVNIEGMKPGDIRTITISVNNQDGSGNASGYSQSYTLELDTTGNLPLQYSLTKAGTPVALTHPASYQYVSAAQEFTANIATTSSFILTMAWPANINSYTYKNEIDYLQLRLRAVQL